MDIVKLSDELISEAMKKKIEDLYILPNEQGFSLVERKGTEKKLIRVLTPALGNQLIIRFKYLGKMDVAEIRKAQLGAITYHLTENRPIRLRLSTVGDYLHRESMVIRLLYPFADESFKYDRPEELLLLEKQVVQQGLFLFSGSVGSGKTTLMYQLAKTCKGQVITIEDPVEIEEDEFLQLQVNPHLEQEYDQLIKVSLRHRPDLLIIGEIRDRQTAKAVVRAALTGHRVFATIHARTIDGTKQRLYDLLSEKTALDTCLKGIIYQQIQASFNQEPTLFWSYRFFGDEGITCERIFDLPAPLSGKKGEENAEKSI